MKTTIKYLIIFLLMLSQVSCEDWLDLQPTSGLVRDEFWKSKEDVEAVLMAAYGSFSTMDRKLFVFGEVRADLLRGDTNQGNDERLLMQNNIFPNNGITNWADFYKVINYCNEVIKNAPEVRKIDQTFTDFQMYSIMSEAYFLRSLSYFYLVRLYRDVPLVLTPSESDDTDFYIPKSSEETVLAQIVTDLESNRQYAPSGGFPTLSENKGRASKAAFDALLADIALWHFQYEKALEYIRMIEQNIEIQMMPTARWFEIFYPGNSLESIFEFQFDGGRNQRNGLYDITQRFSYNYDPSQKALEMFAFEYASELIRGEGASIKKYGDNDYIIWKYVGQAPDGMTTRAGENQYSANWIVYRLADIKLMKAEALSQLERYNEALAVINSVRQRADVGALSLANTRVAFEDAIMNERALELAFEGKRWFDLLRMGRRDNYSRKEKLIEIIVSNVPSTQKRILAAKLTNPLGWYLPVYDKEIERNKNLVQNPFYDY